VSPNTRSISEQVRDTIKDSGGRIRIYDPATGIFTPWKP
jgi:hypothetical protein